MTGTTLTSKPKVFTSVQAIGRAAYRRTFDAQAPEGAGSRPVSSAALSAYRQVAYLCEGVSFDSPVEELASVLARARELWAQAEAADRLPQRTSPVVAFTGETNA